MTKAMCFPMVCLSMVFARAFPVTQRQFRDRRQEQTAPSGDIFAPRRRKRVRHRWMMKQELRMSHRSSHRVLLLVHPRGEILHSSKLPCSSLRPEMVLITFIWRFLCWVFFFPVACMCSLQEPRSAGSLNKYSNGFYQNNIYTRRLVIAREFLI